MGREIYRIYVWNNAVEIDAGDDTIAKFVFTHVDDATRDIMITQAIVIARRFGMHFGHACTIANGESAERILKLLREKWERCCE